VLSQAGDVDCKRVHCSRGDYRFALARDWRGVTLGTRLERTAFLALDDALAVEDRAALTSTVAVHDVHVATSAFVARTRPFDGGPALPSAGAHATVAHDLAHGLIAVVDGEATTQASRVLLSLGWQRSTSTRPH
jgi:hypothetical protein